MSRNLARASFFATKKKKQTWRHEVARNVADDGHTVKQLHATLRATISRVDTRCSFHVARKFCAQCCIVYPGRNSAFLRLKAPNVAQ